MFEQYSSGVEYSRTLMSKRIFSRELFSGEASVDQLELFWIYYCALGPQITAPVEGWIRTAANRCNALGFVELGKPLLAHAKAEAGHDELMRVDTYSLVKWRAKHGRGKLDANKLLRLPATPAMQQYIRLHDDIVDGEHAYAQIAIEYEIEMLSRDFGPHLISITDKYLPGFSANLSFLVEHVRFDVGHTAFNERQMKRFLATHGNAERLAQLVRAGSLANITYGDFFDDCWELARNHESSSLAAPAELNHS